MSFSGVVRARHKLWAQKLLPPYAVFFGIACVVSFISLASKGTFLFDKLRSRSSELSGPVTLTVQELRMKDALDQNRCVGASPAVWIALSWPCASLGCSSLGLTCCTFCDVRHGSDIPLGDVGGKFVGRIEHVVGLQIRSPQSVHVFARRLFGSERLRRIVFPPLRFQS